MMCKWFSIKVKNKKKMHLSMYSEKRKHNLMKIFSDVTFIYDEIERVIQ